MLLLILDFWYKDYLYKVTTAHTVQESWTPDVSYSLFVKIALDSEGGTVDNPIQYSVGMKLIKDKYYVENGVKYLCIRELAQSVWNLSDLIDNYVTIV